MEDWIYYLFFALAIVLTVLGAVVVNKTTSAQKDAKNSGMGVLVIGVIFLVASGFAIFHKMGYTSKLYYF